MGGGGGLFFFSEEFDKCSCGSVKIQKRPCWGRHQNTSVETGDFLQKNVKCMLVEFCRSVTPSPHVRVKGYLGDDSQLLLYCTW